MARESAVVCPECGGYGDGCLCDRFDELGITNGGKARERRRRRRDRSDGGA